MKALIIRSSGIRTCRATACFLLVLLLFHAPGSAEDRETEMFNAGYEYLFSFKPEKAAETFRAFLREFPDSSARDAAMFWLGKTLVSMRSFTEAEQTFLSIKKDFPESPFVSFIDNELEEISRQRSSASAKGQTSPLPSKSMPEGERAPMENDARIAQLAAERDRLRALLEEEKRSIAELQQRNSDLMARGSVQTKLSPDAEERWQKISVVESALRDMKEEREKLFTESENLRAEKSRIEKERDEARQQLREYNQQQHAGDSPMLRISELEQQVWQKETELAQAKEVQEKLRLQADQERRSSEELRAEVIRLKDNEKEQRSLAKATERQSTEKTESVDASRIRKEAAAEARRYREQLDLLQAENRDLSSKVETMEYQAEQRMKDMKILNTYLTKLMFIRKEEQKPKAPSPELEALKTDLHGEKKRSADLREKITAAESREADLKKQIAALKDKQKATSPELEALKTDLNEEKKRSSDLKEKIAAADAREADLKKQVTALKDKPKAPSPETEALKSELNEEKKRSADLKERVAASEARESDLRQQLASLKDKSKTPSPELESLKSELNEEKKQTTDLKEKITAAESREADLKKQIAALKDKQKATSPEMEALKTDLNEEKKRSSDLKEKTVAAETREADLRKQLADLREQKPIPPQRPETKQPVQDSPEQTATISIKGTPYPLSTVMNAAATSNRTLEKLGIRAPVWRSGDPLEDFINEKILSDEAMKTGTPTDEKKYQDTVNRLKLTADETAYLRKFMMISGLINRNFKSGTSELFIETLTVDFGSGDASAKTKLATDLQKAARSGKPFEDIQKMHRDSVKFSRMTVDEFAISHKDKSQIIKKLNFMTEETVVMWSEKGYMILKPVTASKQFDSFADISKEEREKIKIFLSSYLAELRKNM